MHSQANNLLLPDVDISYYPDFFSQLADNFFDRLQQETCWQQENITLYDQAHSLPRLTAWYGDPDPYIAIPILRYSPCHGRPPARN